MIVKTDGSFAALVQGDTLQISCSTDQQLGREGDCPTTDSISRLTSSTFIIGVSTRHFLGHCTLHAFLVKDSELGCYVLVE